MSKKVLGTLALGLCVVVMACCSSGLQQSSPHSPTPTGPATPPVFALWPQVPGRLGSYNVQTTQEVADLADNGLSMVLKGSIGTSMQTALVNHHVSLVDGYPWGLILAYGCADYFSGKSASCQISDATAAMILSQLENRLAAQKGNSNVVAYWFLDDYPGGDVSALLEKMHELLVASNNDPSSSFPRPAICGFGGRIAPLSDTHITDADPLMAYFKISLTNFSPSYCDMVALYPYAVNDGTGPNDPAQYDWSMRYMLPAMFHDLSDRGWNSSMQPLIGVPQAFGYGIYVTPTGADIAAQMTAYCKAGAVTLMAYSWDDGSTSAAEPFNSADMRAGLAQGLMQCHSYWPSSPT